MSKNVTVRQEVSKHLAKLKDRLAELNKRHEEVEENQKLTSERGSGIDTIHNQIMQMIQGMQADQGSLETEYLRSSKAKLKNLMEQVDIMQKSYQVVSVERDQAQQNQDVILIELERLKKRISDLLDDNPEMTEKQFENLSRKEVSL